MAEYIIYTKNYLKNFIEDKFSFEKDVLEKHVDTLIIKGKNIRQLFYRYRNTGRLSKAIYDFK